jgi:hypothetical protein
VAALPVAHSLRSPEATPKEVGMSTQMRPFLLAPGGGTSVRNPVGGELVFKLKK